MHKGHRTGRPPPPLFRRSQSSQSQWRSANSNSNLPEKELIRRIVFFVSPAYSPPAPAAANTHTVVSRESSENRDTKRKRRLCERRCCCQTEKPSPRKANLLSRSVSLLMLSPVPGVCAWCPQLPFSLLLLKYLAPEAHHTIHITRFHESLNFLSLPGLFSSSN